jgi:hypothetical protein
MATNPVGMSASTGLVTGEAAGAQAPDVDHPDHPAVDHEGDPEQRPQALVTEDRAHDLDVREVLEDHGPAVGRDVTGHSPPDRDPHPQGDLLLEPVSRADQELPPILGHQEEHDGVRAEGLTDAAEQLAEQVVQVQVSQRGVGDVLETPDALGRRLDLGPRDLLAGQERLRPPAPPERGAQRADDQGLQDEDPEPHDAARGETGKIRGRQEQVAAGRPRGRWPARGAEPAEPGGQHDRPQEQRNRRLRIGSRATTSPGPPRWPRPPGRTTAGGADHPARSPTMSGIIGPFAGSPRGELKP